MKTIRSEKCTWSTILILSLIMVAVQPATAAADPEGLDLAGSVAAPLLAGSESTDQVSPLILAHPLVALPKTGKAENGRKWVAGPKVQSAGHLAGSHLGIVVRPVSSLLRLLALLGYSTLDALRPTPSDDIPSGAPPPVTHGPGMDLVAWEKHLDRITGTRSSYGSMKLLINGDEFFPLLEKEISEAEESVFLQTYIYDNDDYAVRLGNILKKASGRADVRVLMDGLGTSMAWGVDDDSLPPDHVAPASAYRFLKEGARVRARKLPNPFFSLDHSKLTVIDSKTAFVGGMNIGREYRYVWHDMMVKVQGPVVGTIEGEFKRAWNYAGILGDLALLASYKPFDAPAPDSNHYPVRVLKTRIGRSQIYNAHVAAIRRAKSYIFMENPYLSDDVILHELIKARHRGVDVRVVYPPDSDWNLMDRSNAMSANKLMKNGVRVYLYPGMSHVKATVIDGWACIGSANMDKASLRLNRELDLATSSPALVQPLLQRLFMKDFEESILLTEFFPEKSIDKFYEMVADLM